MAVWLSPLVDAEGFEGDAATAAEMVARGVVEGSYDPKAIYRPDIDSRPPELDELILVIPGGDRSAVQSAAERGVIIGEGANHARTMANRSANEMYPEALAEEARGIAERHGLWIDVIDEKRATDLGMGMFMAVGRGSSNPPRLILLRSGDEGQRDSLDRHLAIVGKGVCFDSGGISIKPSDRMEEMKMDKAGACTVIAAIETVARLAPGTPLLAVAPAVENMPGPHSTRPGDIVTALNGKKVDITNTDAEGRLILGDAHDVRGAARRDAPGRCRDAHRGRRPCPWPSRDRCLRAAAGLVRRRRRRRGPCRASAIGSCRSSRTTSPTWRAGTPTSRTPGRPRVVS